MVLETFNVHYSLVKFLKGIASEFDLHMFLNRKLTQQEEAYLGQLSRWLVVSLDRDDSDILQPVFVNFALFARPESDPTTIWLTTVAAQFYTICLQRKEHTELNVIPIFDYDSIIGESELTTFQKTAQIPSTLLATLSLGDVPYYTPCGQHTGFKVIDSTAPKSPDTKDTPYKVSWRITFRYFQPEHMAGAIST